MRALITGAGGFAGRHLARHLLDCGDEVLGADVVKPASGTLCPIEVLDVCNLGSTMALLSGFRPDAIYHLAGMAYVPDAENDFEAAIHANVIGSYSIYQSCQTLGLPASIVLISSAEVYGKVLSEELPLQESTPARPANNYSLTKLMAEDVAHRFEGQSVLRSVVIRPFNHIGAAQNPKFVTSAFARQLAQIAVKKLEPIVRVGNLEAKRDFSDVRDVMRGYRLAALKGSGVYNFCSGRAVSIGEVLEELISISGLKVRVVEDPDRMRGPEVHVLYGSFEKARLELGWVPEYSLRDSLTEVYRYWLEQESL